MSSTGRPASSRFSRISLAVFAAVVALSSAASPAVAAPITDFNAGNIISDELFYNGQAMQASEIQTFLNQQLSTCRIGTPPYMPGSLSPSGSGNIIASDCLKNYKQNTTSRASDAYCQGYVGVKNETSAQIIEKVGKSCGISQKVLLVMLEKEQSLLTDSWPVTRQYNYALGMNCPDSGPGNSANCDADSAGFALQLYLGARQLKVYRANPDLFRYKPFQNNTIQWNPNAGCGTSQVYIENWATAALYIYTPYRPNQAALNAGWGTGDSCSSYGNRNFFNFYKTWFGFSPQSHPQIDATYSQNSWLGSAQGGYTQTSAGGGGIVRGYVNGVITWKQGASTAYTMRGTIRDYYNKSANGLDGPLGWPTSNQQCADSNNCTQSFENGSIALSAGSSSVEIPAMKSVASQQSAALGNRETLPIVQTGNGGGFVQAFQGGAVTWNKSAGAYMISGDIRSVYGVYGGTSGSLGWPVTAANRSEANGGGTVQGFQNAAITSSPSGTFVLTGPIRTAFGAQGGLSGSLGWPASAENGIAAAGGGSVQAFQNGALTLQQGASNAILINGENRVLFNAAGGIAGTPGWPVTNVTANASNGGGTVQGFQNAAIASSTSGTYLITGPIRSAYAEVGGLGGIFGWPTSAAVNVAGSGGGVVQTFQGGEISQRTGAQEAFALSGDILSLYLANGGYSGTLGWAVTRENRNESNGGGYVQGFQNAALTRSSSGTFVLSGDMRTAYNARGGLGGELGWPASEMVCAAGVCTQSFQNGTLSVDSNTGQATVS